MESNILHFRLIRDEVEKYRQENGIPDPSRAFLEYVLETCLGLDRDEILDAVFDGTGDKGIDAIHIDDSGDRPIVFLVQSKFFQAEDKYNRMLKEDVVQKMRLAISDLILQPPEQIKGVSVDLLEKLQEIKNLSFPIFEIVFCFNSAKPELGVQDNFKSFIELKGNDSFKITYVDLSSLAERVTPAVRRVINTELRLSGKYFDWSLGSARVLVGRVSGSHLADLCAKEGMNLFDRNVRGYLSPRNIVNNEIYKTATDEIEGAQFFFLNNGVTIVCSKIDYLAVDESPEIKITNLQIVNGGQTTNTIFKAQKDGKLSRSVSILVKIIATDSSKLIERITESTNTQTSVKGRDLRSNDEVQKTIEEILKHKGFYYERRKNAYRDLSSAKGKRVDMEIAAQSYYAYSFKEPANAKNKKRQLFGDLYETLFDSNNKSLAEDILISYRILDWVRKTHQKNREQYTFVKHAELHSIALFGYLGLGKTFNLEDEKELEENYERILSATRKTVEFEKASLGDKYSHRTLFIDPLTYEKIVNNLK